MNILTENAARIFNLDVYQRSQVMQKLIVIGGDASGMRLASQARKLNSHMEILVFERGEHVSYSA